jgi:Cu/Ag efflux pump CusA
LGKFTVHPGRKKPRDGKPSGAGIRRVKNSAGFLYQILVNVAKGVSEVASVGGFVKEDQVMSNPILYVPTTLLSWMK